MAVIKFHTFVNNFAETKNFFNRLLVTFFNFFNNFQWSVFFTEHTECFIVERIDLLCILFIAIYKNLIGWILCILFFLYLHAIIGTPCTFNVKSDCTSWRLALHASTIFFEANNTLKRKSFLIYFIQLNSTFRFNCKSRYPCSTAKVNPFILSRNETEILTIS